VVTFEVNTADLSEEGKSSLKKIVPEMLGLANKIDIRGHVSPLMAASGDEEEMWDLCQRRARTVRKHLIELGIQDQRIRISVAGPHEPIANDTPNAKQDRNSRVEVFLLSETVQQFKPGVN
jgi:chemotaxis protein MotB